MHDVEYRVQSERSDEIKADALPAAGAAAPKPPQSAESSRRKPSIEVCVGIAGVIVAIATLAITHWDFDQLNSNLTTGLAGFSENAITLDGNVYKPPKGPLRVQFWTPSVHTKETPGVKEWEKIANDDKLNELGDKMISQHIVTGYRRYEVFGAGTGGRKQGTWWVSTGQFKFIEFLKLYHEVWHPGGDDIYMEIASAAGGHSR